MTQSLCHLPLQHHPEIITLLVIIPAMVHHIHLVVVDHAQHLPALITWGLLVESTPDSLGVARHHVGCEG